MAATIPTRSSGCSVFLLLSVLSISTVSLVGSQPQNIEVYFPFPLPTPLLSPPPPPPPSLPPPPLPPPPPPPPPTPGKTSSDSTKTIATAVAVTAASTVVVSALIFFVLRRRAMSRGRNGESRHGPSGGLPVLSRDEFSRFDGHVKGLIVDENGLDVLYWRQLQGSKSRSPRRRSSFMRSEVVMASPEDGGEPEAEEGLGRRIQEVPLLLGKPSTSERNSSPTRPQLTLTLPPPVVPPPPAVNIEAKIEGGSIKADDDLMEALFGYVAANRKTPRGNNSSSPGHLIPGLEGQIFILDAQKSQDIALILRSLSVSRKDIINALLEGQGLDSDTLGKLSQIAPTREEELKILAFGGDPTRLADAESFLFHILKAIPSAFTRFSAMLLRRNYESEILHVREPITTVELGCNELRAGGLLAKLLQVILKAGNRMNPGTARALNISALKKLSDVKSTDGNTTLLHFVVEEVVRSEGRRCAINGARSMSRSGSFTSMNSENPASKDAREKEYVMLGLPVVGGLSAKFSNVKKAASIDYESFAGLCGALQSRVSEIRQLVSQCEGEGGGGFATEMRGFLESADAEIASLRKDQAGAVELAKETAEHYQAGASKEKGSDPIKLFIIVRDFLGMVDRICIEIAREVQKKKPATASAPTETPRKTMRFPKLPSNFLSDTESNGSVHDL